MKMTNAKKWGRKLAANLFPFHFSHHLLFRFSTVNLSEVVKKSKIDSEKLSVNVYSTSYPHELIALLAVTFEGILFMKELLRDM